MAIDGVATISMSEPVGGPPSGTWTGRVVLDNNSSWSISQFINNTGLRDIYHIDVKAGAELIPIQFNYLRSTTPKAGALYALVSGARVAAASDTSCTFVAFGV